MQSTHVLWRRAGASLVDFSIFGLIGWLLVLQFGEKFIHMGGLARLIGFPIHLAYFGLLNSKSGKGQTLGKKLCGIRTIDASGNSLSLGKSFLRAILMLLPIYANGLETSASSSTALNYFFLALLIIFVVGDPYLVLFNRRTRQSLHDILVGSYGVKVNEPSMSTFPKIWRGHFVILAVTLSVAGGFYISLLNRTQEEIGTNYSAAMKEINQIPEITRCKSVGKNTYTMSGLSKVSLIATANVDDRKLLKSKVLAQKISKILIQNIPDAVFLDKINVTLVYQVDIGLWAEQKNYTFSEAPNVWNSNTK